MPGKQYHVRITAVVSHVYRRRIKAVIAIPGKSTVDSEEQLKDYIKENLEHKYKYGNNYKIKEGPDEIEFVDGSQEVNDVEIGDLVAKYSVCSEEIVQRSVSGEAWAANTDEAFDIVYNDAFNKEPKCGFAADDSTEQTALSVKISEPSNCNPSKYKSVQEMLEKRRDSN